MAREYGVAFLAGFVLALVLFGIFMAFSEWQGGTEITGMAVLTEDVNFDENQSYDEQPTNETVSVIVEKNLVLDMLDRIDEDDLRAVRALIRKYSFIPGDTDLWKAYRILFALERETNYDTYRKEYVLGEYTPNDALLPADFLRVRRGICVDYALTTVVALLEDNVPYVYYLDVSLSGPYDHAAAAVREGNTFFVLDQSPPPVPLEEYCRTEFNGGRVEGVDVYLVEKRDGKYLRTFMKHVDCYAYWGDTFADLILSPEEEEAVTDAVRKYLERKGILYHSGASKTTEKVLNCQVTKGDLNACEDLLVTTCRGGGTYWSVMLFDEYEYSPVTVPILVDYSLRGFVGYGGYNNFGLALRRVEEDGYEYYLLGLSLLRCG